MKLSTNYLKCQLSQAKTAHSVKVFLVQLRLSNVEEISNSQAWVRYSNSLMVCLFLKSNFH